MANTKRIGTLGEYAATQILLDNGYTVSREVSDSARYDLITDLDGILKRVQVKTMRSSSSDPHRVYVHREKVTGGKKNAYTKDEVDQVAWFIEDKGYLILIDIEVFGDKKNMHINLPSPVEPGAAVLTQQSGVRFLLGAPNFESEEERAFFLYCREWMREHNGGDVLSDDPGYTKFATAWAKDAVKYREWWRRAYGKEPPTKELLDVRV